MSLSSDSSTLVRGDEQGASTDDGELADALPGQEGEGARRRFTVAMTCGSLVAAIPFLWILWGTWQPPSFFRKTVYEDNFYDMQARAMFHGHLWLAKGALGIEAFVHNGREYTYFGLFPSILRMPILALTSRFDGRLTAPFMLLAWVLTAVFVALLFWRVRILIRGSVAMSSGEAWSYGLLAASVMGGSVLLYLASNPYVFNEDIAWSVCLTVGGIFAMLGMLEHPSWGRATAVFVLLLACNLDRANTGWASVGAAVLIAAWFAWDRHGDGLRRWSLPMLAAGLVPLAIGCAVNYAKFGVLFGVSNYDQVWTHVNAYRRRFLAANHNAEEGVIFVPSDLLAYLRPDGIRFTSAFPFITLPSGPAPALGGVLFDRRYRTASVPASMPLLSFMTVWGLVTAFRPHPIGKVALTRILFLGAGAAAAALFVWGYIAPRYLGDFMPLLVLGSAVAVVDLWRRAESRTPRVRSWLIGAVALLAAYSVIANIGLAITPNEEWNSARVLAYVQEQQSVADFTGASLQGAVQRGSSLPGWGPADQLFVVGDCAGLYISNGENYSTDPTAQFVRTTWMTVELGHGFLHTFDVSATAPASTAIETVTLVTVGSSTMELSASRTGSTDTVRLTSTFSGGPSPIHGVPTTVRAGRRLSVLVTTDVAKRQVGLSINGVVVLASRAPLDGPVLARSGTFQSTGTPPALTVTNVTDSTPQPSLCRSLTARS